MCVCIYIYMCIHTFQLFGLNGNVVGAQKPKTGTTYVTEQPFQSPSTHMCWYKAPKAMIGIIWMLLCLYIIVPGSTNTHRESESTIKKFLDAC